MIVLSLLFIIIWPAAGGDTVRDILTTFSYLKLNYHGPGWKYYNKKNTYLPTIQTMTLPPLPSGTTGVFAVWICFAGAECVCVCGVLQC